jgi:hypothetical protein
MGIGVLAVTGLAILPYKRATLKQSILDRVTTAREKYQKTLTLHFEQELERILAHTEQVIKPFSSFVEKEKAKALSAEKKLNEMLMHTDQMTKKIDVAFKK